MLFEYVITLHHGPVSSLVLLELAHFHLSLVSHLLPIDTGGENGLLGWVASHHVLSLVNDLVLIELLHLTPDIKLEHGFMVLEPAVLDSCDVEAWQGDDARNDRAAGDQDAQLSWLFTGIETIVIL